MILRGKSISGRNMHGKTRKYGECNVIGKSKKETTTGKATIVLRRLYKNNMGDYYPNTDCRRLAENRDGGRRKTILSGA